MAVFQHYKREGFSGYLWRLLPAPLLSLLSSSDKHNLQRYENAVRDSYFGGEGGRLAFYVLMAMDSDRFKALVMQGLEADGSLSVKRFSKQYRGFLRILLVHACTPSISPNLSRECVDQFTGQKANIVRWMMVECGWLVRTGWKNHFKLSDKGERLVEAVLKQCEREYSTFYVGQMKLKQERMGDLWDEK